MTNQQEQHVFISYVRENQEQVDRLCHELERHGVKVWLDRYSIQPGGRLRILLAFRSILSGPTHFQQGMQGYEKFGNENIFRHKGSRLVFHNLEKETMGDDHQNDMLSSQS